MSRERWELYCIRENGEVKWEIGYNLQLDAKQRRKNGKKSN